MDNVVRYPAYQTVNAFSNKSIASNVTLQLSIHERADIKLARHLIVHISDCIVVRYNKMLHSSFSIVTEGLVHEEHKYTLLQYDANSLFFEQKHTGKVANLSC